MIALRPYQEQGVAKIRTAFAIGRRRVLFVLPTGGGKTVVFSYVTAHAAARGRRVGVLVHRQELVDQVSASLAAMGVPYGIVAAGYSTTPEPVQVASVATLARRLADVEPFDLLVVDEAHHAVAGSWQTIADAMPDARMLGVTATPERLDGRGLGDIFDHLVLGPTVADLTATGFLVPAVVYAPPEQVDTSHLRTRAGDFAQDALASAMSDATLVGNAVEHYAKLCRGVPAVAFCCGIDHSQLVAERFRKAGFRAAHVDGTTDKDERRRLIAALGSGDLDVLTNAGLISEGTDVPAIGAAILLRPTQSLGLYLQQVGRALRPAPGKARAIILDHAGNSLRHGLPCDQREWTLDAKPRGSREKMAWAGLRGCEACGARSAPRSRECTACGAELSATPQEIAEQEAELVRVEQDELRRELMAMPYARLLRWADGSEERLRTAARVRGYHHGWVRHQLTRRHRRAAA